MNAPNPNYDLVGALNGSALGYVLQQPQIDRAYAQYAANNFSPLTSPQLAAVLLAGALEVEQTFEMDVVGVLIPPGTDAYPDPLPPVYPKGLPRFPDSNEEPFDFWVQYGAQMEGYNY